MEIKQTFNLHRCAITTHLDKHTRRYTQEVRMKIWHAHVRTQTLMRAHRFTHEAITKRRGESRRRTKTGNHS